MVDIMALNKEELGKLAGERHFDTEALPDGRELRGRTLLRGEKRRRNKFLQDNKGELDSKKMMYIDDIFAAYHLCDDNGDLVITPEEAFDGFFDNWDTPSTDALLRLMQRLKEYDKEEDAETVEESIKNSGGTSGTDSSGVSADGTESE